MLRECKRRFAGIRIWAVLIWLLIWQGLALLVGQAFLLPAPLEVLKRFVELVLAGGTWSSLLFSGLRILCGFLLGLLAGMLLAALSYKLSWVRSLLAPLQLLLRAVPVASFVLVALIWLPARNLSLLVVFLTVFPLIYQATESELERCDQKLIEMARLLRMPRLSKWCYIYALPVLGAMPGSIVAAMGLAWKSGAAAELIAVPSGSIGERLYMAKIYLMTGELFAWTMLIVLLSALSTLPIKLLLRGIVRVMEGA